MNSLDEGLEVRGVFLDISKAFDKVWHEGLIYKLQQNGISGELLNILVDFLNNRKQSVVLNGQSSNWVDVKAGVPQGSIMGPLLFLIYINDLPEGLITNAELLADDTSLFSVVRDITVSTEGLNNDLRNVSKSVYQWKMIFNPDLTKQEQEVIFSRKLNKPVHPYLTFNNSQVSQTEFQKHLGLILDNKLNFNKHLKSVLDKISKNMGLIRKFRPILPRFSLITINKTFVRPHLNYGDTIYDQTYNASFHRRLESIQYSACLEITGTISGTSYEQLNQELGFETLQSRRWFRKLCLFYKIVNNQSPSYLFDYISSTGRIYNTRNAANVPRIISKHNFFRNSYFPSTIIEWNKLDKDIRNAEIHALFTKHPLSFIRPEANNKFNKHNAKGIKLLPRLRVGFSHLKERKFRHNFVNAINPLCSCGNFVESIKHFFLHFTNFSNQRLTFINKIKDIDKRIFDKNDSLITQTLLFGDEKPPITDNKSILEATIQFLIYSARFVLVFITHRCINYLMFYHTEPFLF